MSEKLTATLKSLNMSRLGDSTGSVFGYRNVTKTFARTVERAGKANFTLHDLRHTFASRLVMEGIDLATAKELMGHQHSTMTLRYTHLTPGHKRTAIAALDRIAAEVPTNFITMAEPYSGHMLQVFENQ